MSATSRDKIINGHPVFGIGGDDRGRVSDTRSNNNVVDEDEVNRLPGETAT